MRQIFLDTETTGLSAAEGDRIVEIGCIELDDRRPTGRPLHHYVNPQRSSHPDAVRIHGITDEFLADKPPFSAIVDEVLAFVEGAEVQNSARADHERSGIGEAVSGAESQRAGGDGHGLRSRGPVQR